VPAVSADAGVPPDAGVSPDADTLYELTVAHDGTGDGTVVSDPAGINCGADCTASFPSGTTVTLTATPGETSKLVEWSGACAGSASTCDIVVDATKTATARFDAIRVTQVAAGSNHTCALLDTGAVRCWGYGANGRLGYGNTDTIGDDEAPAFAGDVDVGGTVTQLAAGVSHTCALLDAGAVRCWGDGDFGRLGYGNTDTIGDDETPASAGDVDVGGTVTQIAAGAFHTCALLDFGAVRCWGRGLSGQLGYGNTDTIGDDETPASAGNVIVGGTVTQIAAGGNYTCALLETGAVRCWGAGSFGPLGYGNVNSIGDDETPASAGSVIVGGTVAQVAAGDAHTCALLDTGAVRCWGFGANGRLGYGNTNSIGDDEIPASAGDIGVGGTVTHITTGGGHTCALRDTGAVRCWGLGTSGALGYGNTDNIGDDETPATAGDVPVL
jgi:alpha-tubulin suppressor-like RCC1 family protein